MRSPLAVLVVLLAGLAVGAPRAATDTAPPVPTGHWSGLGGARVSWADSRHGWRLFRARPEEVWFRHVRATEDGGKHWKTILRMRRRLDGVAHINRLSERVGVAVVWMAGGWRALLTVDNGRAWHVVERGREWRLFEGTPRTMYVSPRHPESRYSKLIYRLDRWPSTRPRYVRVFSADIPIVSLRTAPGGFVALLRGLGYRYWLAIQRRGRTEVVEVPGTGFDATPQACEAFRFTVDWPLLSVVTEGGPKCDSFEVDHVSLDGGRTWQVRYA